MFDKNESKEEKNGFIKQALHVLSTGR